MRLFTIFLTAAGLYTLAACTKDIGPNPDLVVKQTTICDSVSFINDIKPIFDAKCVSCHVTGTSSGAPWDYTTYQGIKDRADDGTIRNRAVILQDMPQGGPPLPQNEIDLIKCWLDAGAPNN
ncbi:MAG: hypothetical protein V4580_18365 [Bacteroidota bacterium]